MGGFTFIVMISVFSFIHSIWIPIPYTVDLFLIAAVYISLSSDREQTLFIVWGLGLARGIFSCSPFAVISVSGASAEPLAGLYMFHPLAFIGLYLLLSLVRSSLMSNHPLTRFLTVTTVSSIYYFLDILLNLPVPFIERVFLYWGYILAISCINGLCAVLLFRLFSRLPIKVVAQTVRGDF